MDEFAAFVKANYKHPRSYWDTPDGRVDLRGHAGFRLSEIRSAYIPWLDSVHPLKGLRILDIGCGTGSSTVALAEQGADVTGVEMDEPSLTVGRRLCEIHGVQARFLRANAAEAHEMLEIGSYDMLVFFAVFEHMTAIECMSTLSACWKKMKPGALLGVMDTPNRLWIYDSHTAYLPFFHWLPGEIAIRYCAESPRPAIADLHRDTSETGILDLQRWGRGISFHEFELAIGPVGELPIVSSFGQWRRRRDLAQALKWIFRDRPYNRCLHRAAPHVAQPWLEPYLDLVIRRVNMESSAPA